MYSMKDSKGKRQLIRDQEGLELLAKQLVSVRKRYGHTQQSLADKAGLSLSQIARIETAVTNPTISTLMRISRVLDIPLSHLFEFKLDKLDFEK